MPINEIIKSKSNTKEFSGEETLSINACLF